MSASINDARMILGLTDHSEVTIGQMRERYKELMIKNDPDNGGSDYFIQQIQMAKDVLEEYFQEEDYVTKAPAPASQTQPTNQYVSLEQTYPMDADANDTSSMSSERMWLYFSHMAFVWRIMLFGILLLSLYMGHMLWSAYQLQQNTPPEWTNIALLGEEWDEGAPIPTIEAGHYLYICSQATSFDRLDATPYRKSHMPEVATIAKYVSRYQSRWYQDYPDKNFMIMLYAEGEDYDPNNITLGKSVKVFATQNPRKCPRGYNTRSMRIHWNLAEEILGEIYE